MGSNADWRPDSEPTGSRITPGGEKIRIRRFGAFEVDLRAGELRRNGIKIKLQEQPLQVLTLLLERPGEVVSREDLRNRLWLADTFVDFDHSLNAAIKRLRDALGDSAEQPRFVETVARRGYRFLGPVESAGNAAAPVQSLEISSISNFIVPAHRPVRTWQIAASAAVLLALGLGLGLWLGASRTAPPGPVLEKRLTANPSEAPVTGGVISPDGKYIAFSDHTGFYLRQVDTGETHPVPMAAAFVQAANRPTERGSGMRPLSWFPDGVHLVVGWVARPQEEQSLWLISVLGGMPRKLADEGFRPGVSPDGSRILFVKGGDSQQELWIMQSDGEGPHKEVSDREYWYGSLAWSPDGQSIAYVRAKYDAAKGRQTASVLVRKLEGGKSQVLIDDPKLGSALAWMPDGRIIYSLAEAAPNQDDSNLWSVKIDGDSRISGAPIRLTSDTGFAQGVSITTDGKRLAFFKQSQQPDVYISDLNAKGTRLGEPRHLTLDERADFPYAWTPDGKAVLFISDRDGPSHIFKQGMNDATPELLVGGTEQLGIPRLDPQGTSILYLVTPKLGDSEKNVRLMRVPLAGGPPQYVLDAPGISNQQCARLPATLCLFSEVLETEERFFSFDPVKGQPTELVGARVQSDSYYDFNWTLSPDGKILAMAKKSTSPGEPTIRLLSLSDYSDRTFAIKGWNAVQCLDWAADAKSLWASVFTNTGSRALVNIDMSGKIKPMLLENKMKLGWGIPSPDGRHLALWESSGTSNLWMLENY